jgi:homeobox protein MSX
LPRIPFTPHQLTQLEQAFISATYLSTEDANKLAKRLDLTGVRVKIWFQNRRARDRRERKDLSKNIILKPSDDTDNEEEIIVS